MKVSVYCLNKAEFKNKADKMSYVLELVDLDNKHVYKAFTSSKHYAKINADFKSLYTGYLSFENGFTKFYFPKNEV